MLAAMRASPAHSEDVRRKPGRQWVTFLLVCNFALWGINTFETQRTEHNLLQVGVGESRFALTGHFGYFTGYDQYVLERTSAPDQKYWLLFCLAD